MVMLMLMMTMTMMVVDDDDDECQDGWGLAVTSHQKPPILLSVLSRERKWRKRGGFRGKGMSVVRDGVTFFSPYFSLI